MQRLYDRFIEQLDSLVLFLALGNEEVFRLVWHRHASWMPSDQSHLIPSKLESYRVQIAHAGFLLGYSYAESFLNDVARQIYLTRPELLPGEEKIRFKEILGLSDYDNVLRYMVETTLFLMLRGSMKEIIRHFEVVLQVQLAEDDKRAMIEASMIRNCIIHKMAIADDRLADFSPRWTRGEPIALDVSDVHQFGIVARRVAELIRDQVGERYGGCRSGGSS
jgi:hypothetical protein